MRLTGLLTLLVLFTVCSAQETSSATSWPRLEAYLGSLIAHAPEIATISPHAEEDIRALATDLARKAHEATTEDARAKVLTEFRRTYREIFPEKDAHPVSAFTARAKELLSEIPDVLPLLVEEPLRSTSAFATLPADVSSLRMRLSSLADEESSLLWFQQFESMSEKLLALSPPTPLPILREDLRQLLTNLTTYLLNVENMEIDIGTRQEEVRALSLELQTVTDEAALDRFLQKLETLLTHLTPAS